jgi:hypothetical protein
MQRSNAHIPKSLAGLTIEEAIEFEVLDALPPFDDYGEIGWIFQGNPTSHRERRWLELRFRVSFRRRARDRKLCQREEHGMKSS